MGILYDTTDFRERNNQFIYNDYHNRPCRGGGFRFGSGPSLIGGLFPGGGPKAAGKGGGLGGGRADGEGG